MKTPTPVLASYLGLILAFLAASPVRAATVQRMFLAGESIPAPHIMAPNARQVLAAREIQAGPHHGETADAYGRRAEAVALALGMNSSEAAQAREFYRRRAAGGAGRRSSTGPPLSEDWRAALGASRGRIGTALRVPDWGAKASPVMRGRLDPAVARAAFPAAGRPLVTRSAPKRAAVIPPPPARPASPRAAPAEAPGGSFIGLLFSRAAGSPVKAATFYSWADDYNRRGNAITERSSGDSLLAWADRKRLKLQGTMSNLAGFVNDNEALGRSWASVKNSVVAAVNRPVRKLTFTQQLQRSAFTTVNSMFPGITLAAVTAVQVKEDGAAVVGAVKRYRAHPSNWTAADAALTTTGAAADVAGMATMGGSSLLRRTAVAAVDEVAAAGRFGRVIPRPWLREAEIHPALAETLETHYRRTVELERQFASRKRAGAPRAELDAIREESWQAYRQGRDMQAQIPSLRRYFEEAAPGAPGSDEFMRVVATNMGTDLETVNGVRLASYGSLKRDIAAGGIMPNPNKALGEGVLTGSGAHLLADGSPHMVSVADRLQGGLVLLMTGYADASRAHKIEEGIMYEFEGVRNAARLPPTRQVFFDVLGQSELMVPSVPLERIRHVRAWRSRLNPADPTQVIFEYTDRVPLDAGAGADAIQGALKGLPPRNQMRVAIPDDTARFTYRTEL